MRDNDRILQIIGDSQSFMKAQLAEILKADANPETLRCFVECLQQLDCGANNLSDGFAGSSIIRGVAVETINPVARSLDELTKRIEQSMETSMSGSDRPMNTHDAVINNQEGSDLEGKVLDSIYFGCDQETADGNDEDRRWILKNVVSHLPEPNCTNPTEVRDKFWLFFQEWQALGATIWADCGVPVEANFLRTCVAENPENRTWEAPYPLHEIATALLIAGREPTEVFNRLPEELPAHHPVNDARQSARILRESLRGDRL